MPGQDTCCMLNVLWFKPEGGAARYRDYLRAAAPLLAKYGGRKLASYVPEEAIIGKFDADLIFVVEWPSRESFDAFVNDPEFLRVRPLREEAIRDSLLIQCRQNG